MLMMLVRTVRSIMLAFWMVMIVVLVRMTAINRAVMMMRMMVVSLFMVRMVKVRMVIVGMLMVGMIVM